MLARLLSQARPVARRVRVAAPQARGLRTAAAIGATAAVSAAALSASFAHLADFESCDVIGDGLKGEFWKARHKNINVLELESEVVQLMMTKLRDKKLTDEGFVLLAERVAFFVIEHALAELPTKEVTVETVYGHNYTGTMMDESIKLCGVGVAEDGGQMLSILTKLIHDMPVAHLQLNRGSRRLSIIPNIEDIHERHCLVLAPVMKTGQTIMDSIARLIKSGVDEENIVVVSITSGPGALDNLAKNYPDVQVVTASIEAGLDRKFQLMPGVGVFSTRYSPEE